jgi:tetratricopeptide (TPR) repeat protein
MARELGQRETQGAALRKLSELHSRHGRFQEALRAAAQAVQILQESEATQELGLGYGQLASVLEAMGQPTRAASAREKAGAVRAGRGSAAGLGKGA